MAEFDLPGGYKLVVEPLRRDAYSLSIIDSQRKLTGWARRTGPEPWLTWDRYVGQIAKEIGQPEDAVKEALKNITKTVQLDPKRYGLVFGSKKEDGKKGEEQVLDEEGKPVPPEQIEAGAMEFLRDPKLLYRIKTLLDRGFVMDRYRFVLGEDDKKLLTFCIEISAQTSWPQNLFVVGPPGFGKTNILHCVSGLMPEGYVKRRAYFTGAAMRYTEQAYKVLFLVEWRQSTEQDVRLISKDDGGYMYEIAVRDPETGEMTTQIGEIPAKSIVTTTAESLPSEQMLRRTWLLSVDESKELTKLVNQRKAEIAAGKVQPASMKEVAIVRKAVQLLQPKDVIIPFAGELIDLAPWDRSRFDALLDLIRVVAFLHQYQRPTDSKGRIVATPADLFLAMRIGWPTLAQTIQKLPDRLRKVWDLLPDNLNGQGKTSKELAKALGLSQSSVRVYLADLVNLGYALEERIAGGRTKQYWKSGQSAELLHSATSWVKQINWQKIADLAKNSVYSNFSGSVTSEQGGGEKNTDTEAINNALSGVVVDPLTGKTISLLSPSTPPENVTDDKKAQIEPKIEKEGEIGEIKCYTPPVAQYSTCNTSESSSSKVTEKTPPASPMAVKDLSSEQSSLKVTYPLPLVPIRFRNGSSQDAPINLAIDLVRRGQATFVSPHSVVEQVARALQVRFGTFEVLELGEECRKAGVEPGVSGHWINEAKERGEITEVSSGLYQFTKPLDPTLQPVRLKDGPLWPATPSEAEELVRRGLGERAVRKPSQVGQVEYIEMGEGPP
jgi:energy-coupling factor transporter ATP-binding protein EcfA2